MTTHIDNLDNRSLCRHTNTNIDRRLTINKVQADHLAGLPSCRPERGLPNNFLVSCLSFHFQTPC